MLRVYTTYIKYNDFYSYNILVYRKLFKLWVFCKKKKIRNPMRKGWFNFLSFQRNMLLVVIQTREICINQQYQHNVFKTKYQRLGVDWLTPLWNHSYRKLYVYLTYYLQHKVDKIRRLFRLFISKTGSHHYFHYFDSFQPFQHSFWISSLSSFVCENAAAWFPLTIS